MRRLLLLAACASAVAGCVSVEGLPDPRGALKPGQRLVVDVYPSPGPWIIGSSDTKAESAAKLSPLGFLVQTAEDQHTLSVSQNLQQYLPRPRLGEAVQKSLLTALRSARSTDTIQTGLEAGIAPAQLADWNKSRNQLDWRQRYYAPDPDQPAPRDYAKILTLDDALILDVNVSFGTDATDDNRLLPTMSAASRVYRGDTSHLIWEHEDVVSDQTSSATMTDIQVQPSLLTDGLQKIAPSLGTTVANSFLKAFFVTPSTSAPHAPIAAAGSSGGGLVPMSFFQNMSTSAPSGVVISTVVPLGVSPSTTAASGISASTIAATSPPAISSSTVVFPTGAPNAAAAAPPAISSSTPPAVSTPTLPAPAPPSP